MNEFSALISNFPTKKDVNLTMSQLEKCEHGLFRSQGDIDKFVSEQFPERVASAIEEYARVKGANLSDPVSATDFFKELRKSLSNLSVVVLRIAFEPTKAQIARLSELLVDDGQSVIFELKYDPDVIGGAVVEYKGKIGDYSLSKKLKTFFEASKMQNGERIQK